VRRPPTSPAARRPGPAPAPRTPRLRRHHGASRGRRGQTAIPEALDAPANERVAQTPRSRPAATRDHTDARTPQTSTRRHTPPKGARNPQRPPESAIGAAAGRLGSSPKERPPQPSPRPHAGQRARRTSNGAGEDEEAPARPAGVHKDGEAPAGQGTGDRQNWKKMPAEQGTKNRPRGGRRPALKNTRVQGRHPCVQGGRGDPGHVVSPAHGGLQRSVSSLSRVSRAGNRSTHDGGGLKIRGKSETPPPGKKERHPGHLGHPGQNPVSHCVCWKNCVQGRFSRLGQPWTQSAFHGYKDQRKAEHKEARNAGTRDTRLHAPTESRVNGYIRLQRARVA
jgi:hypothetical protein